MSSQGFWEAKLVCLGKIKKQSQFHYPNIWRKVLGRVAFFQCWTPHYYKGTFNSVWHNICFHDCWRSLQKFRAKFVQYLSSVPTLIEKELSSKLATLKVTTLRTYAIFRELVDIRNKYVIIALRSFCWFRSVFIVVRKGVCSSNWDLDPLRNSDRFPQIRPQSHS